MQKPEARTWPVWFLNSHQAYLQEDKFKFRSKILTQNLEILQTAGILTYLESEFDTIKSVEVVPDCLSFLFSSVYERFILVQVIGDVLAMNTIARNLHARRFQQGALRLDKTKLSFSLNQDGNPQNYRIQCKQYTAGCRVLLIVSSQAIICQYPSQTSGSGASVDSAVYSEHVFIIMMFTLYWGGHSGNAASL